VCHLVHIVHGGHSLRQRPGTYVSSADRSSGLTSTPCHVSVTHQCVVDIEGSVVFETKPGIGVSACRPTGSVSPRAAAIPRVFLLLSPAPSHEGGSVGYELHVQRRRVRVPYFDHPSGRGQGRSSTNTVQAVLERGEGVGVATNRSTHLRGLPRGVVPGDLLPPIRSPGQRLHSRDR